MTRKIEPASVGYPDFSVLCPPRLSAVPVTLRRTALAKLAGVRLLSAEFGAEAVLFQPWLTVLIDRGPVAFLTGVYRSDEDAESGLPVVCLRKSEWSRDTDLARARNVDNLRDYLLDGPQVSHTLRFATRATHPELDDVMGTVLTALRAGLTVSPGGGESSGWEYVSCDLADERLTCRVAYSPLTARCEALENALPPWLDRIGDQLRRPGVVPDGKVTISIERSVPELAGAEPRYRA